MYLDLYIATYICIYNPILETYVVIDAHAIIS